MKAWFGAWPSDDDPRELPFICVTRKGIHFNNEEGGYNAHWYDLRHPLQRYSRGDYRFVEFFKQIGRGLRLIFTGKMF